MKKKNLSGLVAMAVLLGGVSYSGSVWAGTTITINGTSETSAGYSNTAYVGADGKQSLGNNVDKIQTASGGVAHDVYGIKITGSDFITATSISNGIDVKSTNNKAYGISLESTGTNTISGLGSIMAEGNANRVSGIYAKSGTNTITFTGADSSITVKNSKTTDSHAYAIAFGTNETTEAATGTTKIENLGNITIETGCANVYGIYGVSTSDDARFSVVFATNETKTTGGTINVWSEKATGLTYEYGIRFNASSNGKGQMEVLNVNKIVVGVKSDGSIAKSGKAYGIYGNSGTNKVVFTGADSSIVVRSKDYEAYGIYTYEVKNTVDFPTTGGTIDVCSEKNLAYGIKTAVEVEVEGITTVNNVKTITACVNGDSAQNPSNNGQAYGIHSMGYMPTTVTFTGAGSSVTANSTLNNAYGICLEHNSGSGHPWTGMNTISGLGSITAETTSPIASANTAYGIYFRNVETEEVKNTSSVGFDASGGSINTYSASGCNHGINFVDGSTGKSEVKNVKTITSGVKGDSVGGGSATGIYAQGGVNTVTFTGAGSSITAKSSGTMVYGIAFGNTTTSATGTMTITGLGSITAETTASSAAFGIISKGEDANSKNNVSFSGANSKITVTSAGNAYGIRAEGKGTTTVTNLGSITAETSATDKNAYGIFSAGTDTSFENNVSFKGNGGQAIIAMNTTTPANAYSIYAEGNGATTVNFESSILSGKVNQYGDAVLTLNFNDGGVWRPTATDVTGKVNVNVKSGGTIDTRTRDAQGKVTTAATKTINLGTGTFTAQAGSEISFDAVTAPNGLTTDQIKAASDSSGTIALGTVNVKDSATEAWGTAKSANLFVKPDGTSLGITITGETVTMTSDDRAYIFKGLENGKISATSVAVSAYTLPQIIQGTDSFAKTINAYSLNANQVLSEDLGTLNNSSRTSGLTIYGNSNTISKGTAPDGTVTMVQTTDVLTLKDVTVSGFTKFADNAGTLNLSGVTFTGTTGTDVITGTGKTVISGVVTADKNIAQQVELQNGANLTVPSISVDKSTGSAFGISATAGTNTVTFTGAGGSITSKSSDDNANGIDVSGGMTTISNIANITVSGGTGVEYESCGIKVKGGVATVSGLKNITVSGHGAKSIFVSEGTLILRDSGITADTPVFVGDGILVFDLPPDCVAGTTILKITGGNGSKIFDDSTLRVINGRATGLKTGDIVTLIDDSNGISLKESTVKQHSSDGITFTDAKISLDSTKKKLLYEVEKISLDPDGSKAPVEGMAAAAGVVNTTADIVTGAGMANMITSTATTSGTEPFAAASFGNSRLETGSHVDSKGYGIVVGVGKKVFDKIGNKTTGGLFVEYGNSDFDTYNNAVTGSGKSINKGVGYMMRWDNKKSGNYYEGMLHGGKINTSWSNSTGGYNMNPTYFGGALTYGHKFMVEKDRQLSVYGSYIYNRTGGGDAKIADYNYSFGATNSHRTKVGVRYAMSDLMDTKKFRPYVGLAWEHEYKGDTTATVRGFGEAPSPSMKGDSGILEIGCKQEVGKWTLGIGAELFTGKRRGWNGTLQATLNF